MLRGRRSHVVVTWQAVEEIVASLDLGKRGVSKTLRDKMVVYRELKVEMEALSGLYPESPGAVKIWRQNKRERETEVSVRR